jgi:hypothetical protein
LLDTIGLKTTEVPSSSGGWGACRAGRESKRTTRLKDRGEQATKFVRSLPAKEK